LQIQVLYFAATRELAGTPAEDLTLPPDVRTLAQLFDHLVRVHPALHGRLASVRAARNEQFAAPEEPLAEGDTVALIPPVAGG
jgi:molybdopterin converting factor subunit 1